MKREICTCRALKTAALALAFALTQGGLVAQTVNIPDPSIQAAVRGALLKPVGDITVADMELLTVLEANSDTAGISDLTGLEKAINLTDLEVGCFYCQDNPISDLSPIEGLTNLRKLEVWRSKIRDIGPLAGLTNLRDLYLAFSEIDDLGPLAGLTSLTELELWESEVRDLSPLAGLAGLTSLWMPYNKISDIGPITELTNLNGLGLASNRISDISPLAGLTGLSVLHIQGNHIDITPGSPARQIIDELNAIEGLTVEFEPQNDPEPLIGGIPMSNSEDWYRCDWWGEYCTTFAPWIYHAEHGFLYRDPISTYESMFVYDNGMGAWCWTNETIYPFIYAFNPPADNGGTDVESCWLFYFEGSSEPRSFAVVTGDHAGSYLYFNP